MMHPIYSMRHILTQFKLSLRVDFIWPSLIEQAGSEPMSNAFPKTKATLWLWRALNSNTENQRLVNTSNNALCQSQTSNARRDTTSWQRLRKQHRPTMDRDGSSRELTSYQLPALLWANPDFDLSFFSLLPATACTVSILPFSSS